MKNESTEILDSEIGMSFSSTEDEKRYIERVGSLVNNQDENLPFPEITFKERVLVDNPSFKDFELLEDIYSNMDPKKTGDVLCDLYKTYEKVWSKDNLKSFIRIFPSEKLRGYSAKTVNGNLARLEIQGKDLNELKEVDKKEVIENLAVLRNTWYCYYGFYDLKLIASYLEFGKSQGLNIQESLAKFVEKVSDEENDTYYLVFGGKKVKDNFIPQKVLGHIGMVDGLDYPQGKEDEIYNPKVHVSHVDKLHLPKETLDSGGRIIRELKLPVKLKNVKDIVRFVKSPFVSSKKQIFVAALLSASIIQKGVDMQKDGDMLIFADVDREIAGKTAGQMGYAHSYSPERFVSTSEKQGLLMPRWLKDPRKLVSTGPTLPLFFTGRDLVESQDRAGSVYKPTDYLDKVFKIADTPNKLKKIVSFLDLIKESTINQLYSIESKYVRVNKNGEHEGAHHTGQVGGPEGLINVVDNKLAFDIAERYYGESPRFLPLPYNKRGFDFATLDKGILDRILYPLRRQNLSPALYNLSEDAQITPLGNCYAPMLRSIDDLESEAKVLELGRQQKLVQDLLARSKFLPLIGSFLNHERNSKNNVKLLESLKARYFKKSELKLAEVRDLTNPNFILDTQEALFSNSLFVCAGLGTGGMQLVQDLRKSIPVADYILLDHGVVDSDNGHQMPSVNELGASKLAVAVDSLMKDVPISPWGSKENLLGGVYGFATPYSPEANARLLELVKSSGKENIVLIDEIDVTEGKTILQKIEFHKLAINLSREIGKPVSVVCGLDLGQSGVWRGHFVYEPNSKPFYGLLEMKDGVEQRIERISPLVLLAPLLIGAKLPTELELLIADMARDGSIEGVGQTVYSSNQSSTHVGNSAVLASMMQSLGYQGQEMRNVTKTTYIENPMKDFLNNQSYERYKNFSGRDGFLLFPFLLYLSGQIYKTEDWPKDWKSLADPKIAYYLKSINASLEV